MQETEKVSRLRLERVSRGWTLEEVQEKTGYRLHTLAAWEVKRTKPNVVAALTLAKLYETTVEQLFSDFE